MNEITKSSLKLGWFIQDCLLMLFPAFTYKGHRVEIQAQNDMGMVVYKAAVNGRIISAIGSATRSHEKEVAKQVIDDHIQSGMPL